MLISRTTNHALHKRHTRQRARHQTDTTHRPSAIATAYKHEFKHPNGCKAVADTSTKRVLWYGGTTKPDDTGQPGRTSRSHKQSPPSCVSALARMPRHLIPRTNEVRSPPTPNFQKRPARCVGRRRRAGGKKHTLSQHTKNKANIPAGCRKPSTVIAKRFPRPALSASCAYGGACRACRIFDARCFVQPNFAGNLSVDMDECTRDNGPGGPMRWSGRLACGVDRWAFKLRMAPMTSRAG
jgi:hypothetical protein